MDPTCHKISVLRVLSLSSPKCDNVVTNVTIGNRTRPQYPNSPPDKMYAMDDKSGSDSRYQTELKPMFPYPPHTAQAGGQSRISSLWAYLCQGFVQRLERTTGDSRGSILLETVVAVVIFALIGAATMVGIQTATLTGERVEDKSIAENLARNQMEHVFSQAYKAPPLDYDSIADIPGNTFSVPSDFTVTAVAVERPGTVGTDIETVKVTVSRNGQEILVLETIRGRN